MAVSLFDQAVGYGNRLDAEASAVPLIGHCIRELTRVLPRFANIPGEPGRIDYEGQIKRLARTWSTVDRDARVLSERQFQTLDRLVANQQASEGRTVARSIALARTNVYGALDQEPPLLEGLAARWRKLERAVASIVHVREDGSSAPSGQAAEVLERFEVLLDQTLAGFWDIDSRIKATLASGPSADAYAAAKELPKSVQHWRRLYEGMGPEWLKVILDAGDFDAPPAWATRPDRPLAWPAIDYLERVAPEQPDLAASALFRVPDLIDEFSKAQVLGIAAGLDAKAVRPLAARAAAWVRRHPANPIVTERAGQLMARLARGRLVEEAFDIAKELLALPGEIPPGETGRDRQRALEAAIGEYEFERMLERHFTALIDLAPVRAATMLIETLDEALRLAGDQYWRIWLPDVGNPRAHDGVVQMLVGTAHQALVGLARTNQGAAEEILLEIARRPGAVMRRLELAALEDTSIGRDRLNELYGDPELFHEVEIFHEYAETLPKRWPDLRPETRERIRDWIRNGYRLKDDAAAKEKYEAHWRRRWLAVLAPVLPDDWKVEFAEVLRIESPQLPTRLSWTTMWSGARSPLTVDQIKAMSSDELIRFLETWTATDERGPEPTVRGLANLVTTAVADDPSRFIPDLARFRALARREYANAVSEGLVQAVRNDLTFEWPPVIEHLELELARTEAPDPQGGDGARWIAARLLEEAMTKGRETFPTDLRERAFGMIRTLAATTEPEDADEERASAQRGMRGVAGTALETAIHYGLWVARNDGADSGRRRLDGHLAELGALLEDRLAAGSSSVRAIPAVFLPQLMYLDEAWVREHLDELVPVPSRGASNPEWDSYLDLATPFTGQVFELMRRRYEAAVEGLSDGVPDDDLAFTLGMNVLVAAVRGWDGGPLMATGFFALAPVEIRGRVLGRIGHELMDSENEFSPEVLSALEGFWRQRLARSQERDELAAFGAWFASGRFGTDVALELLRQTLAVTGGAIHREHEVASELRVLAPNRLREALELFDQVLAGVAGFDRPWRASALEADGLALVRLGLASEDSETTLLARRIRDRFGLLGFSSFGEEADR